MARCAGGRVRSSDHNNNLATRSQLHRQKRALPSCNEAASFRPQTSARAQALVAYKDFLSIWKDADPDIPILKEAKGEYAALQQQSAFAK